MFLKASNRKISFKKLIETHGSKFKEDSVVHFMGTINKELGIDIEGDLKFSNLPRFAPMKAIFDHKPALHTEKGSNN